MVERTWVCCGSAGSRSWGETRAAPRPGQKYRYPQPKGAQPVLRRRLRWRWTPIPGALGVPRGPPLPFPPEPHRITPPWEPRLHRRPPHPTHWLLSRLLLFCLLSAPACRQLVSFVCAGQCPQASSPACPAQDTRPLGASRLLSRSKQGSPGCWKTHTRVQEGESAGEELGVRGEGTREGGKRGALEGRGKQAVSVKQIVGKTGWVPRQTESQTLLSLWRSLETRPRDWGGTWLGYRMMLRPCLPGGWQTGTRGGGNLARQGSPNDGCTFTHRSRELTSSFSS